MKSSQPQSTSSSSSRHSTDSSITPQLAPPGAGLPWPQRILLRYALGPLVSTRADWDESLEKLARRHAKIAEEWALIQPEDRGRRVLVPSQPGLEDSSRYWSAEMVLEHLWIVGSRIEGAALELSQGRVPHGVVDTAQVKPMGRVDETNVTDWMQRLDEWMKLATTRLKDVPHPSRKSKATLTHPWFGEFRASQWVWLLGEHHGIHLRQLRGIRQNWPR
ncbi:MAG TPA: hypothetical protein PLZ57_09620 [Pseudobdellovibrionaceae bacterium]|nr:hypothetical protein [Pseudobdellovibrionaceae bacterium]